MVYKAARRDIPHRAVETRDAEQNSPRPARSRDPGARGRPHHPRHRRDPTGHPAAADRAAEPDAEEDRARDADRARAGWHAAAGRDDTVRDARLRASENAADRKRACHGTSVTVRVSIGGSLFINKKNNTK